MTAAAGSGDRWQRTQDLFHQALEVPEHERRAFLDRAVTDAAERAALDALLDADRSAPAIADAAAAAAAQWLRHDGGGLIGRMFGRYRIIERIGAGGMGEVFKAHDERLDRMVAVKLLSPRLAHDDAARGRFEREARAIAALSHPHICALFDIGSQDGIDFLVMDHLDGETLAARLGRGALPCDEALQIARDMADALDAAHRAGIIHRDLKPGNVMLTPTGAKLLDFGIARLTRSSATGDTDAHPATGGDMGTIQYMAPEQLKQTAVDGRADIWALGCVLYEMLTGHRAFAGKTDTALVAAILEERPRPVGEFIPDGRSTFDRLTQACLARDPNDRWQSVGDLRHALQVMIDVGTFAAPQRGRRPKWPRRSLALAIAAVMVAAAFAIVVRPRAETPPASSRVVTRARIGMPDGVSLRVPSAGMPLALSRDGQRIAYVGLHSGRTDIYVQSLDSDAPIALPNTGEAVGPAFSPDGQWVAFTAGGKLKKVPVAGGSALTLGDAPANATVTWIDDQHLLYGADASPIRELSLNDGTVRELTTAGVGAASHLYPDRTRSGALLFSLSPARILSVLLPGATAPRQVLTDGLHAHVVMNDTLVFGRAGGLWAAQADVNGLPESDPRLVVNGVRSNGTQVPMYAVASNGTLVYVQDTGRSASSIVWVDRAGREDVVGLPARPYRLPRLSPDGRQLLVSTADGDQNLWRVDLRQPTLTRLTFNPRPNFSPVWSRDGRSVFFTDTVGLLRVDADGGEAQVVLDAPEVSPTGVTPDGTSLLVSGPGVQGALTGGSPAAHIGLVKLEAPRVIPLISDPGEQRNGTVSPDGRWLAYQSNESGQFEIYIRPFPGVSDGKWQVSVNGGLQPIWSRDGRELFYRTGGGQVLAVAVRPGTRFTPSAPRVIIAGSYPGDDMGPARAYDVAPDGQRFLFVKGAASSEVHELHVVLNWDVALRASMQTPRP